MVVAAPPSSTRRRSRPLAPLGGRQRLILRNGACYESRPTTAITWSAARPGGRLGGAEGEEAEAQAQIEPADEDRDETEAEPEPDDEAAAAAAETPTSWASALRTGILGPGSWLATRFGPGTAWTVHVVGVWAIGFYGGWIAAGVAFVWLAAVLQFIPTENLERATAVIERWCTPAPKVATAAAPEDEREAVRRLVLRAMRDAEKCT
ncbi:hypothetical protein [Streptomyces sp. NPDC003710]